MRQDSIAQYTRDARTAERGIVTDRARQLGFRKLEHVGVCDVTLALTKVKPAMPAVGGGRAQLEELLAHHVLRANMAVWGGRWEVDGIPVAPVGEVALSSADQLAAARALRAPTPAEAADLAKVESMALKFAAVDIAAAKAIRLELAHLDAEAAVQAAEAQYEDQEARAKAQEALAAYRDNLPYLVGSVTDPEVAKARAFLEQIRLAREQVKAADTDLATLRAGHRKAVRAAALLGEEPPPWPAELPGQEPPPWLATDEPADEPRRRLPRARPVPQPSDAGDAAKVDFGSPR